VADEPAPFAARWWWALLALILVSGFTTRAWNLDFDQGQHLHPDERHWALTAAEFDRLPSPERHGTVLGPALDWLDGQRSPANPYRATPSFVYGPVMLAAARSTAGWMHSGVVDGSQPAAAVVRTLDEIGIPLIDASGSPTFDTGYDVEIVGRLLAALLDTITIAVVGLIGRRLFGPASGLVAAGFYAGCVLAIQHGHFLGSEPLVGLCSALLVLATIGIDRSPAARPAIRSGLLVGLTAGASMAAKLNTVGLVLVPLGAFVTLAVVHRRRSDLFRLLALAVGAFLAFRVLHPAAFDGLSPWFSDSFRADLRLTRTQFDADIPPWVQWADRTPLVQPLIWLVRFTVGPGIVLAAILGTIVLVRRLWGAGGRGLERWPMLIVLAAVAVPFIFVSLTSLPTGRYFIPILPALCAIAGLGITATWRWAAGQHGAPRAVARVAVVGSIGLAALWGIAFVNGVYGRTHTRIEATEWIVENVEPGSVLSAQAWDDALPLRLPGVDTEAYPIEQLVMVGTDSEAKIREVARQLRTIDYVVESSPRLWGVVERIPARFPSTIMFFESLDSGALGFERVATFTNRPSLGWFSIDDSTAEEAFSVYDHPEVRIWQKTSDLSTGELLEVLDPAAASRALTVTVADAHAGGLLLTDDESAALADGPSYASAFDLDGPRWAHAIGWFLLLELLGLAAFVLFLPVFRNLPDAGFGIAKTLGLTVPASTLFIASSWFGLELSRTLIVVAIASMVILAGAVIRRRREELRARWMSGRRLFAIIEGSSVLAFVGLLVLRAANPDLWHPARGGEKPFELAVLTAVLRTDTLPPYDAWFSGGVLNYYYFGYALLLAPARLLATSPSVIMNIAPAVFAACTAAAACSLGAAVAASGRRSVRRRASIEWAAIGSVFAVLALSNLAVFDEFVRWRSEGGTFDWWALSRVIPDSGAITEFPAWSLLFTDLHPHLIDVCVLLTLGVVAITLHHHLVDRRTRPSLVTAATAGMLIGVIRATNTWDFPLAAGSVVLALMIATRGGANRRTAIGAGAIVLAMVVVVWSPYTRRGLVFDSGLERNLAATPLSSWFSQFGLFAAISVLVVVSAVVRVNATSPTVWRRVRFVPLLTSGVVLVGIGIILLSPDAAVIVVTGALFVSMGWLVAADRSSSIPRLGLLVLSIGWLIQTGVELVVVRNDLNRQNTVFKFWYQSWVLLAVGSAVVVAAMVHDWRTARVQQPTGRGGSGMGLVAVGVVAVGVVASGIFWVVATPARLADRISEGGLSLDGEAYLVPELEVHSNDQPIRPAADVVLIDWLRSNVSGVRVIAEAPGVDYQWSSRMSWMTGLPTPLGWQYHETQQRRAYVDAIERRSSDLLELYTTSDPSVMARVLDDHRVEYVVFGTAERALSTPPSAAALAEFECVDIEVRDGELFVASVDRECVSERRLRG
jgi:YYY domain-containing protein